MPAKEIRINLLGTQDLGHTPWGRLVEWATTYGRYIMITTEIVVLLAFISRFSLDRKNTDLTEELGQKQAIIEANLDFERDIKSLQAHLTTAKILLADQAKPIEVVNILESLIPADVYLSSIRYIAQQIKHFRNRRHHERICTILSNLQSIQQIQNVMLGDIRREPTTGIVFQLTADLAGMKSK